MFSRDVVKSCSSFPFIRISRIEERVIAKPQSNRSKKRSRVSFMQKPPVASEIFLGSTGNAGSYRKYRDSRDREKLVVVYVVDAEYTSYRLRRLVCASVWVSRACEYVAWDTFARDSRTISREAVPGLHTYTTLVVAPSSISFFDFATRPLRENILAVFVPARYR